MREILDAILSFIGAESLTNEEFASITITEGATEVEKYEALLAVITDRESISDMATRLSYYFKAQGVAVDDPDTGNSNIFVGARICR